MKAQLNVKPSHLKTKRRSSRDTESLFPTGLCSGREENANYLELLASLDIKSTSRDDVLEVYAQKFKNHALLPLFKKDLESTVSSTDQHFFDANYEIYFDYTIKNYGFKSLAAMHALSVSEIKSIIAWFKKLLKDT